MGALFSLARAIVPYLLRALVNQTQVGSDVPADACAEGHPNRAVRCWPPLPVGILLPLCGNIDNWRFETWQIWADGCSKTRASSPIGVRTSGKKPSMPAGRPPSGVYFTPDTRLTRDFPRFLSGSPKSMNRTRWSQGRKFGNPWCCPASIS